MKKDRSLKFQLNKFNKNGFVIEKIFNKSILENFKEKLLKNLRKSAKKHNIYSIKNIKNLEEYFNLVSKTEHEILMDRETRTIKFKKSEAQLILNKRIRDLLSYYSDKEYYILRSSNKFSSRGKDFNNYAGFRIVEPNSDKVAGYHSDHYNLQNFRFTMWVPLIGFNNKYSLKLITGSHYYKHSKKQIVKNKFGSARLFNNLYLKKFSKAFRPNLKLGEVILFHPYLIHGNAKNLGKTVRVSLEIKIGTD